VSSRPGAGIGFLLPGLRAQGLWLLAVVACSGHRDALARGRLYYEDNRFEQALSVWRELESNEYRLRPYERSRYAYLRGMTDYRLGFRDDARHWLGLAKAIEQLHPGGINPEWMERLDGALDDLDREIFGIGARDGDAIQSIDAPAQSPARDGTVEPLPNPIPPSNPVPP
jgi:hypothetical protein